MHQVNSTTGQEVGMHTVKIPRKHAGDWLSRYDGDDARETAVSPRTVTLELSTAALCDLISDALYYSEEMGPDNTGDVDYRPAARSCLAGLKRAGVMWARRGFSVTLL